MVDTLTSSRDRKRRAELEALLVLDALPGVGPATVRTLVEAAGSAGRALARPRLLEGIAGPEAAKAAAAEASVRAEVRRALDEADRLGMRTALMGEASYPARLLHLADPPPVLFLRGRTELLDAPGVAIVGARRATERARHAARRLGAAVARAGVTVVSGLARGVDAAAHQGALDAAGPTVAVLGCGADRAYPPGNRALFRRIVGDGLVVSEFPPGTPALPYNFPRRNRILAALARIVVVVEAAARSGALITAEHALDLGLDVWAVPGPFGEPFCEGSNALLADGALPLVTVNGFLRLALGVEPGPVPVPTKMAEEEVRVLEILSEGARSADEIARRMEMGAARAVALLSAMELSGWVRRDAGMRFRRAG